MGKIANGGPRPFGYRRIYDGDGPRRKIVRDELDPIEAPIVRECAERALEGETLFSIAKDLGRRGIVTTTGRPWRQESLRSLVTSGRVAGLRERHREVVGPAEWPAIISVEQHQQLRALFPHRNRNSDGTRAARVYWLSGYVKCTCNTTRPLSMAPCKSSNGAYRVYVCPPKSDGGCGSRTIKLKELEELVTELMMRKLDAVEVEENAEDDPRPDVEVKIARWERRIEELKDAFADGDQSAREYREVTDSLTERIAQARADLAAYSVRSRLEASADAIKAEWEGYPVERKKAVLGRFIARILIHPATRPYGSFNPGRVEVVWQ